METAARELKAPQQALVRLEGEREPLAEKCAMLRALTDRAVEEVPDGEVAFRAIGSGEVFIDTPYDVWRAFVPVGHDLRGGPVRDGSVARAELSREARDDGFASAAA